MKKLILITSLLIIPVTASAASFQFGESVEVKQNGNAYAAGTIVQVIDEAVGDVYLAGETIQIKARVREDANLAGENITIDGIITDDLHAFGSTILLNNDIRGDAIIFGQKIVVSDDARITGSAIIGAQSLNIQGRFDDDVRLMGAELNLNAIIVGDAILHVGESLTISEDSDIRGNLTLKIPEGASMKVPEGVVRGEVKKEFVASEVKRNPMSILGGLRVFSLLSTVIIGAIIIAFARLFAVHYGGKVKKQPWSVLGFGILGVFAPPAVAVLLFIPVITIPLALLTLIVWGTMLYISVMISGLVVANMFFPIKRTDHFLLKVGKFALGTLAIMLIRVVPVVGFLTVTVVYLMSIGSLITYEMNAVKALKKARLV